MKVCIYSYFFHPITGGLQTFTKGLAEHLTGHGVAVTLVTETNKQGTDDSFSFEVVRAPTIRQLWLIIANSDVVHINGFALKTVILALLNGKRMVWTHHEYDSICPIGTGWNGELSCAFSFFQCAKCLRNRGMTRLISKRFISLILRKVTGYLVDCNVNTTFYFTKRQNLPNNIVIPIPIDVGRFCPADDDSNAGFFLFFGRLIKMKGVDILIQAVSICIEQGYPVKLMICGRGTDKGRLEIISRKLGIESSVFFEDYRYGEDLIETIDNCLAVVVPSLWDEPFGIVALESLSCGKVVIASDVGGLAELVKPVGMLFEQGNAEALAAKMIELYENESVRKNLERKARQYALNFGWEVLGKRYLQLFDQSGDL